MAGLNIITHYSILMCDHSDTVVGARVCNAATDQAALAVADSWLGIARAVEVWQGPRLVGRCPLHDTAALSGQAAREL